MTWALALAVSLCSCNSISESLLPRDYKEVCSKRAAFVNPNTESAFGALNQECLKGISEEVAAAQESYSKYQKIYDQSEKDAKLRKEFEESKRIYEQEKIAKATLAIGANGSRRRSECTEPGGVCPGRSTGTPIADFAKELRFQSYKDWIVNYKYRETVDATGWSKVNQDIQELITRE